MKHMKHKLLFFILQHKYCLHAVMVHEGEAISGHYWSYVFNREANVWLKFNDISVTETSWEEVARESEGGSGTASAYCLIYTQSADNAELYSQGAAANALPTSGIEYSCGIIQFNTKAC